MNYRKQFFSILKGATPEKIHFVPDISDWYLGHHRADDGELEFPPGGYIPDEDKIKNVLGTMDTKYEGWTLLDFYRNYNWACHCHLYGWYECKYSGGVLKETIINGRIKNIIYRTPIGELVREYKLAVDGTWCPTEYLVKDKSQFKILRYIIENENYSATDSGIVNAINNLSQLGQGDLVISRSPFGKILHEYLGFEATIFGLYDFPELINEILEVQERKDLEVVEIGCKSEAKLAILVDHADETLFSPTIYKEYCMPFYDKLCDKFHSHGKYVSTHLDGNFKGFFPLLKDLKFDILDGCTPAPMFNYEPEELAEAMPKNMMAFVGVPASMFCIESVTIDEIYTFADRIVKAFNRKVFLNVGDILSYNGDINKVIALGEYLRKI
jgi:hypothetical protein